MLGADEFDQSTLVPVASKGRVVEREFQLGLDTVSCGFRHPFHLEDLGTVVGGLETPFDRTAEGGGGAALVKEGIGRSISEGFGLESFLPSQGRLHVDWNIRVKKGGFMPGIGATAHLFMAMTLTQRATIRIRDTCANCKARRIRPAAKRDPGSGGGIEEKTIRGRTVSRVRAYALGNSDGGSSVEPCTYSESGSSP